MGRKHEPIVSPKPIDERIRFSFRYYEVASDYCLSKWASKQIEDTFLRLKQFSDKSIKDMMAGKAVFHFGEVDWAKTEKKGGFPYSEVNELPPFHFALLGVNGQKARVFGALSGNTFYVVWFDLEHEIWPSYKKHT